MKTHYMHRCLTMFILITLSLGTTTVIQAQPTNLPLLLWIPVGPKDSSSYFWYGDLWEWKDVQAQLRRVTNTIYNGNPVPSPDGSTLAYTVFDKLAVDEIGRNGGVDALDISVFPTNIVILDRRTEKESLIANQPTNSVFKGTYPEYQTDFFVSRTAPTWSPDGQEIAWVEFVLKGPFNPTTPSTDLERLVVYNLASKATTVIMSNSGPRLDAYGVSAQIARWGKSSIAVRGMDYNKGANGRAVFSETLFIYDVKGRLLSNRKLGAIGEFIWATKRAKDYVAILTDQPNYAAYNSPVWVIIDPATSTMECIDDTVELFNMDLPSGMSLLNADSKDAWSWQMSIPSQQPIVLPNSSHNYYSISGATLSSDGQQAAYTNDQGQAFIYRNGTSLAIQAPDKVATLVWGNVAWRVHGSTSDCDN